MKTLSILFLLTAAAAIAPAAQETSLNGNWQIKRVAADRESQIDCAFTQKNGELAGTCKTDRGTVTISGKVEGKNVTFAHKSESEGGTVTVEYTGKIESADKIAGKLLAVEFSVEGDFTATRAK